MHVHVSNITPGLLLIANNQLVGTIKSTEVVDGAIVLHFIDHDRTHTVPVLDSTITVVENNSDDKFYSTDGTAMIQYCPYENNVTPFHITFHGVRRLSKSTLKEAVEYCTMNYNVQFDIELN